MMGRQPFEQLYHPENKVLVCDDPQELEEEEKQNVNSNNPTINSTNHNPFQFESSNKNISLREVEQPQKKNQQKNKLLNKEKQVNFRLNKKPEYQPKTEEDFKKRSAFKNQIKGFLSKYFKRIKQRIEKNEDIQDMPDDLQFLKFLVFNRFSRQKTTKSDLFLVVNQFCQQYEYEMYEALENNKFLEYFNGKIKPDDDDDDDFSICNLDQIKDEERIKILKKEYEIIVDLRKNYQEVIKENILISNSQNPISQEDFTNFEGYQRLTRKLNEFTCFFRKDIFRYLQSRQYTDTSFEKKADKFDQLYVRDLLFSVIRNPKILV